MNFLEAEVSITVDKDKIVVQLNAIKRKFSDTVDGVKRESKSMSAAVSQAFSKMSASSQRAFNNVKRFSRIAAVGIIGVTTAMIKLASDAQESENLFAVAMGGMADETRKWSEQLAQDLFQNDFEIRKYVATLHVMFQSMGFAEQGAADMSKSMIELALDIASLRNLKFEVAFEKLKAGLVGSVRPLRDLGILIDIASVKAHALEMGIGTLGQELTATEKVQARFSLILKQTTADQGDAARTINQTEPVLKSLRAQIALTAITFGNALLPKVTEVALAIRDWIRENKEQIPVWAEMYASKIIKVATALKDLGEWLIDNRRLVLLLIGAYAGFGILGQIAINVLALKSAIGLITPVITAAIGAVGVGGFLALGGAITAIAVALGLVISKYMEYRSVQANVNKSLEKQLELRTKILDKHMQFIIQRDIEADIIERPAAPLSEFERPEVFVPGEREDFTKPFDPNEDFFRELREGTGEAIQDTGKMFEDAMQKSSDYYDSIEQDSFDASQSMLNHRREMLEEGGSLDEMSHNQIMNRRLQEDFLADELAQKEKERADAELTHAAEIAAAYRSIRGQMGEMTEATYEREKQILLDLGTKYMQWGMDRVTVEQWVNEQIQNLETERAISSDNFFAGFGARTTEMQDQILTWGELGAQTADIFQNSMVTAIDQIIVKGESFGDTMRNIGQSILDQMIAIQVQQLAIQAMGGLSGGIDALFGVEAAKGGGTVGNMPTGRSISPLAFMGAPSFENGGTVGLRAGEVPIIAHRGEEVIPAGNRASAVVPKVIINNHTGIPFEQRNTRVTEKEVITDVFLSDLNRGGPMSQGIKRARG